MFLELYNFQKEIALKNTDYKILEFKAYMVCPSTSTVINLDNYKYYRLMHILKVN